jgi:hypothetical protein
MIERLKWMILTKIRSGFFSCGLNVTGQTNPKDVLALIQRLRPLDCGTDLIRIGGEGDGGYLVPNDLEGIEYCFSPGVSTVSDFEDRLADLHIKSFLADYSVARPPVVRPEMVFDKKFLGASDREPYMTLASWKDKYLKGHQGDLLLQMDIEGFEYEVILNTPDELLNQFRILVIEFHDLERLFDPFCFPLLSSSFGKLLQFFDVVHIHPNNYCGTLKRRGVEIPLLMEFTFLNKRRVSSTTPQLVFPHPLDRDNTSRKPLHLPKCWYLPDADQPGTR